MKPGYLIIIIIFLINIAGIFYNNIVMNIIMGILLIILLIITVKFTYTVKVNKNDAECSSREELKKEQELTKEKIKIIGDEKDEFESKYNQSQNNIDALHKLLTGLDITAPIIDKLSTVIINKSEESTLNATEKIFAIVGDSQNISKDIQILLANMNTGEHSLDHEMDRLLSEVKDFQVIVDKVEHLKRSYINDMEVIEKTVVNIKSLTDSITDIADQTSILAINASIEAARAGSAGVGFAVIAGETQKLASDSKQITEKITSGIKEIGGTIKSSFQRQSETLTSTVTHLQEAKESFHQMTFNLAPQIKNIASSVQKSKDLSESVTARLNEITMSLQYQDATSQILEHVVQLVVGIQREFLDLEIHKKMESKEDWELINTKVLAKASKIFTVREEWISLGLELDEREIDEEDNKVNLQGDITLF
ncbi:MAG: methyl-accepting chemotaxis protein [Spirochaetia bacterium]|nr:methyl-accepting chemotaxis protein [Spirochaetia bacterium]